jgi:hypothetical protein
VIPAELKPFVESGISMLIATRSDRLLPECARLVGARVDADGAELTVFLPAATGERTLANLRDNGRAAVCFARAADHRSLQIKGRMRTVREAADAERDLILRYRTGLAEAWGVIGYPPRLTLRMAHWPCHAITIGVESVFDQTPGPGAGAAFGAPAAAQGGGTPGSPGSRAGTQGGGTPRTPAKPPAAK